MSMDIEFNNGFGTIDSFYNPLDKDVTTDFPGLLSTTAGDQSYYGATTLIYEYTSNNLAISEAFDLTFTKASVSSISGRSNKFVLFKIPLRRVSEQTPSRYLGGLVFAPSSSTIRFEVGIYTDSALDTVESENYRSYYSGTAETGSFWDLRTGVRVIQFPGRHVPYEWMRYGIMFYVKVRRDGNFDTGEELRLRSYSSGEQIIVGPRNLGSGINSYDWMRVIDVGAIFQGHAYGPFDTFIEDVSPEVGPASQEGGYDPGRSGAFDDSSDAIAVPEDPSAGVASVGFINVYKATLNQLVGLGTALFPPLAYNPPSPVQGQSETEAIINGFNAIVTFLANIPSFFDQIMANTLINYVIDCHVIPVDPGAGTNESIKVGPKTLNTVYAAKVTSDYVDKSCGSINVGEYYGNFADFFTSAKLYLPFVGFVPCRPEWFIGSTLSVDYKFNIVDGSFSAYVRSGGPRVGNGSSTIVGVYSGNACMHLPITGTTYASMVSGLVGAGSGMIQGAGTGNLAALATSAISAAGAHGDIPNSNAYNGSAAFLSCRTPFLMIERPVSNYAKNYQHEVGIPSNIYATLSDVSGFCSMVNVHVDGISGATEIEKNEIKRLLAQGVIV